MSEKKSFPEHVAIILDGNGRWAQKRGRERTYGHQIGAANVKRIVRSAGNMGIKNTHSLCFFDRKLETAFYRGPVSHETF